MLVAVGLNQRCAAIAHRERLAVVPDELASVVRGYAALGGVDELAMLATCYRVEIYAATRCPAAAATALRHGLEEHAGSSELSLFSLQGDEALRHLVRVASGLESVIFGEPQMLGEVKEAFARAQEAGVAGTELSAAFRIAFEIADRVAREAPLGDASVSWGAATAALAEKVLGSAGAASVLVLGAGEMAREAARHLRQRGSALVVVNRTPARAESVAVEVGGRARPLDALGEELAGADVVVSAAPVVPAVLGPAPMAAIMRARRGRRLVVVDLAVPRAVPQETGRLEGVYLCDIDDLARLARASLGEHAASVASAERVIDADLRRHGRDAAAPSPAAGREGAPALDPADDPGRQSRLQAVARALVARLRHAPEQPGQVAAGRRAAASRRSPAADRRP